MTMEPDNSSAGTGIHLSGQANNKTLGAGQSHHSSNVGNSQVEEMTLDVRMSFFFFFFVLPGLTASVFEHVKQIHD